MLRHMYECPFKTYLSQLQNFFCPNWQMYFSKLLNVFRSPPPSWSSRYNICTSVQSKYARLGTDLWCAWPVNPQYPTPICHWNRHHHHHFACWSSLDFALSVLVLPGYHFIIYLCFGPEGYYSNLDMKACHHESGRKRTTNLAILFCF